MPLILLSPVAAFIIAVSSVRTRRASANTAMLGALISLAATLLVGWGLARRTTAFIASYVYITQNVAFSGPVNFQNFEIDIVLKVDHLTVVALAVVEISVIVVLAWNRIMGRNEAGPARLHSIVSLFLFGCVGTLISNDLVELLTFWMLTGGATYLLLTHRWGHDDAELSGRIALALPFLTDLFLLCGVAVLYSTYGLNNLPNLINSLHMPGSTVRQLVVASVLLFVGVAGRLALWPLHFWITRTATTAPPAASAIVQAVWPVLAVTVLARLLPIFAASNVQTMRWMIVACGVSAVIALLASVATMEPRRALALVGSGVAAVGVAILIHGFQYRGLAPLALAGVVTVFAAAPARAAAMLAASAITSAMRTDDMREMGEALKRMRASALVLLGSSIAFVLGAVAPLAVAVDSRSRFGFVLGEALFLVGVASLRVFMSVGTGPLRRRRAFDPDRVHDAQAPALGWPYWLVALSIGLGVASLVTGWLGFLDGRTHHAAAGGAYVLWFVVAAAGLLVAAVCYARSKDGSVSGSAWLAGYTDGALARASVFIDRFVLEPSGRIVDRTNEWLPAGDGALGRATLFSGRLAATAARAPALPVLIVMAVLLALLVALLSPEVLR